MKYLFRTFAQGCRDTLLNEFSSGKPCGFSIPYFVAFQFVVTCRFCFFLFLKLKTCGNIYLIKAISIVFPTAFAHFISVSHFGSSHNISNFFIIVFVIVICDQ